jgi:uncharacterized protein with PIN domain
MTIDAQALVAMALKGPGVDVVAAALGEDENPRVSATALAEAGILPAARGVSLPAVTLQIIVDRLHLTVVPFTIEHWREAIKVYEYDLKLEPEKRQRFGRCLSAGVAAKLGAPLLLP